MCYPLQQFQVSVSSSPSVPASTVPPLKDASIYTKPAFPNVIHSIPSHKCPICKEMYVETDIEAHVDICLEKSNSVSCSSFSSFVKRENFSSKDKKVFNVRRSNLVKDALAKRKLFFRDGITPIHVKFVEDPNTIDADGSLREMFTLFYEQVPQYLFCGLGMMSTSWITVISKTWVSLWLSGFCLVCLDPEIGVYLCHGTS